MKNINDIKKQETLFSEAEIRSLTALSEDIKSVIQFNKVQEDTLRKLDNIITTLQGLKENFMWRVIRAAKQNHMLD
jgi:hypothetical protein